jgi:hypothetical protein
MSSQQYIERPKADETIKEIVTINVTLSGRMSDLHSFGLAALRLVDVNCSLKTSIVMSAHSHV